MAQDETRWLVDQKSSKRLSRMQKRVIDRREWLNQIIAQPVAFLPSFISWNPQANYDAGIYVDDLDMIIIREMQKPSASDTHEHDRAADSNTSHQESRLIESIAETTASCPNIGLYGWALVKVNNTLVPCQDLPCVPITEDRIVSLRNSAQITCNTLAPLTKTGTVPAFVAIYSPKMKRISAFKIAKKYYDLPILRNETFLSSACPKISRISLAEAATRTFTIDQD